MKTTIAWTAAACGMILWFDVLSTRSQVNAQEDWSPVQDRLECDDVPASFFLGHIPKCLGPSAHPTTVQLRFRPGPQVSVTSNQESDAYGAQCLEHYVTKRLRESACHGDLAATIPSTPTPVGQVQATIQRSDACPDTLVTEAIASGIQRPILRCFTAFAPRVESELQFRFSRGITSHNDQVGNPVPSTLRSCLLGAISSIPLEPPSGCTLQVDFRYLLAP